MTAAQPALAANFVVINENPSGPGSLRQAVLDAEANGNPDEVDTITFDPGVSVIKQTDTHTTLGLGPMVVTQSLSITGPGQENLTIDGFYTWYTNDGTVNGGFPNTGTITDFAGTLFDVGLRDTDNSGLVFALTGVTITRTGGILIAHNGTRVELEDVNAKFNAYGVQTNLKSFLSVNGELEIRDSLFEGNKWDSFLIGSVGKTLISNTTMVGNEWSSFDHGLFLDGTEVEILDSQILDDSIQHWLWADDVYVANSVFRRVEENKNGALIFASNSHLHLNNVTIYSHSTEVTNAENQPSHLWVTNGQLSIANTVIEYDQPRSVTIKSLVRLDNSPVLLNVSNFVADGSLPGTATGDAGLEIHFVDPFAYKPTATSPLIDAGTDAQAINPRTGAALTTDILGFDRISGPSVDIGAVEVQENHAVNDSYSTKQDVALTVLKQGVLSNDQWTGTLIFLDNGLFVLDHPQHGVLGVAGREGGFFYVPNAGFHGTDTFTYVVATDPAEGPDLVSNEATVTIAVSPAVPGNIIVDKETSPAGASQSFDFTLTGGPNSVNEMFSLTDADAPYASVDLQAGTYVLTETPVDGWAPHGFCDDGQAVYPLDAIQMSSGKLVICTVTNVELDSIVVELLTSPGGGTGFGFTHDIGAGTPFALDDKQSEHFDSVAPGTYTIVQDDPTPDHDLAAIICQGAADQVEDLAQRKVTVTMDPGQTAHCSFLYVERGRIMVEKLSNPGGDPQAFTFDLTGPDSFAQNFPLTDGQTHDSGLVVPGTYALIETVPAGWEQSKAVCDDGSDPTSINVSAGETVTCTITNTEFDSVVVELLTTPGGGTGFGFTHNIDAGAPFSLDDTQSEHFDSVVAGSYTITQNDPSPLDHALVAIDCQGSYTNLVIDLAARSASFDLAAGQTAHCNFANEQAGEIIVDLVTNPSNDPQSFEFHLFGPGVNQSFHLTDVQSPRTSGDVAAGAYHVSSVVPDGWQLDSIVCDDGSLHGDVDLQAGETVTCTVMQSLIPEPSFTITKTPDHNPVQRGDQIEYTIGWENTGDGDAVDSMLFDVLPEGMSFVSASDGGTYDGVTNTVTWDLGAIAASSGPQDVTLVLRSNSNATLITNDAILSFNQDRMVLARSIVFAESSCVSDADCDDGVFCNGTESCDVDTGSCVAVSACPPAIDGCVIRNSICDEDNDVCIDEIDDSLCQEGEICMPPEGPCVVCESDPVTQGYWHRQCLGVPASEGGIDPGSNGRGPKKPTEPDFVEVLIPCAEQYLEDVGFFGTTTCEGMDANPPSDDCERAVKQLTALILNVCSDRLQFYCPVCVTNTCANTLPEDSDVQDLIDGVAEYISAGMCKEAAELAALANEGEAICFVDP